MSKLIAIIQTGEPIAPVKINHGNFDQLFINGMRIDPVRTKTYKVFEKIDFPSTDNLAGIIITGSPSMVTEKNNWSEATVDWLKRIKNLNVPILGVCYGHQLLAQALEGQVDWNPKGRQIGSIKMEFTKDVHTDLLFSQLIDKQQTSIQYQATHLQSITKLPKNVTLLGSTDLDPNHCFRYKNNIWGTQFHPEFSALIVKEYIMARSEDIIKEGLDPKRIITKINKNENGQQLLEQFKKICFNEF